MRRVRPKVPGRSHLGLQYQELSSRFSCSAISYTARITWDTTCLPTTPTLKRYWFSRGLRFDAAGAILLIDTQLRMRVSVRQSRGYAIAKRDRLVEGFDQTQIGPSRYRRG